MLVISPYAKRGFVDHEVMDHTSILKFISQNWNLVPLTLRQAQANDMTSAFDFPNRGVQYVYRAPPPTHSMALGVLELQQMLPSWSSISATTRIRLTDLRRV